MKQSQNYHNWIMFLFHPITYLGLDGKSWRGTKVSGTYFREPLIKKKNVKQVWFKYNFPRSHLNFFFNFWVYLL